MKRWHAWLELGRISNLPTVWTNVLAGWLLADGEWLWGSIVWLLAGGSLLYTAGMILNDAMDVKFDREHRKERPIPSGRVSISAVWSVGVGMLIGGAAMCYWGGGACGWLVLALVGAIVAYDAYHKPWAGSVLIMGSCRALLYLVAGSAVTGGLSWEADRELVIKAVALGGYIVGVTLVARGESKPATSSRLERWVGLSALLLPVGVGFVQQVSNQPASMAPFIILCGLVVGHAYRVMRTPPPSNIGRAVAILLANVVIVDALAISYRFPWVAACFAMAMPLVMLWQRKIAAT